MSKMYLMVGNVGAGKSILARKLALKNCVVVSMDEIQKMTGGGIYGLYDSKKKEFYRAVEMTAVVGALKSGLDIVIDRTCMGAKTRETFIEKAVQYKAEEIICFDFGPGEEGFELRNRLKDTRGIPEQTWREVFAMMKGQYEKPVLEEGITKIYEGPKKFTFYAFDFDGTLVKNAFPDIGRINKPWADHLVSLWQDLNNILIIWTCRTGDELVQMKSFLLASRLPFDYINENPLVDYGGRKLFAHVYYDDRAAQNPLPAQTPAGGENEPREREQTQVVPGSPGKKR